MTANSILSLLMDFAFISHYRQRFYNLTLLPFSPFAVHIVHYDHDYDY